MENEKIELAKELDAAVKNTAEETEPHEKNVKLMSPTQMVLRRFFRSKLSIVGLLMIVGLFLFCWLGPLFYTSWAPTEQDLNGKIEYTKTLVTYTDDAGVTHSFYQVVETKKDLNNLAPMDSNHPLGTDKNGYDVLARIMEGGKISLTISFLSVFIITLFGVVFGGISGYFGGVVDTVIMRICDILMCLPGFPILLIVGTIIEAVGIDLQFRIYYLMGFLGQVSCTSFESTQLSSKA